MTVINTNISALMAQNQLSKINNDLSQSMERLSSGKRINSAADDAAGLTIVSRMDAQIRGLGQAVRNANDGISLSQTAEGAINEVESMLQRMRELALQSASSTYNNADRENLDLEVKELKTEIDRIINTTLFNDKKLLDGSFDGEIQIGAKSDQTLEFAISNLSTTALGTSLTDQLSSDATSNLARGEAATNTIAQLAVNGNDTYGFTLTVGNGSGGTEDLTIANAQQVGGDAEDIAQSINAAIAAAVTAGDLTEGSVGARANGNVVTITHELGDSLEVSSFTSTGNGTISYSSITGNGTSRLLDDTGTVTSIANSGGGAATAASSTLSLEEGKDYQFRVNGELIEVNNLGGTGGTSAADVLASIRTAIGDGSAGSSVSASGSGTATFALSDSTGQDIRITNFTSPEEATGSKGTMLLAARIDADNSTAANTFADGGSDTSDIGADDVIQLTFTEATADYQFDIGGETFTVETASAGDTLQEALVVTRDAINTAAATTGNALEGLIEARIVDGKLELENLDNSAITINGFSSTGSPAITAGAASFASVNLTTQGSATADGTEAVISQMSMQFSKDDDYSFTIGGQTVNAEVQDGSLSEIAASVNALSGATNVTARIDGNQLMLERADGGTFTVANFTSDGTGRIFAANASSQGGSATLTDDAAVTGASTSAAGVAEATEMTLELDTNDDVSFKLSDGRTTAVIRRTSYDTSDATAMLSEIQSALNDVGSDITASQSSGTITLTNSKGGKIELTEFASDGTSKLTTQPDAGQGTGKILDDTGISGTGSAVSSISIDSIQGANSAVDIIDRAFDQINEQRSSLGAYSNRLEHTINNLSNIAVNTEAAKSRILDTDFAQETTKLTKSQILSQAATSMLAQANQSKQGILALLQ